MHKGTEQTFLQRRHADGQYKYEKRDSVIWKLKIKTKVRYHFTPTRITIIKMSENKNVSGMWKNWDLHSLLVRM